MRIWVSLGFDLTEEKNIIIKKKNHYPVLASESLSGRNFSFTILNLVLQEHYIISRFFCLQFKAYFGFATYTRVQMSHLFTERGKPTCDFTSLLRADLPVAVCRERKKKLKKNIKPALLAQAGNSGITL